MVTGNESRPLLVFRGKILNGSTYFLGWILIHFGANIDINHKLMVDKTQVIMV